MPYYYTKDHLGNIREMTNSSGTIVARYGYDSYGRVTVIIGTTPSDMQYAGMYEFAPLSLNFTLNRIYNPNTARWLSRDPLGEGADATLYSYVYNNPANLRDPLGLYGAGFIFSGSGAAGAGTGNAAQSSFGAGVFANQDSGGGSLGNFGSTGSWSGTVPSTTGSVVGASAGVGGGVFATNARCSGDLAGPFNTIDINLPELSISFSWGNASDGMPVWSASVTVGPSTPSASYTSYPTTTNWTNDFSWSGLGPDDFNPND